MPTGLLILIVVWIVMSVIRGGIFYVDFRRQRPSVTVAWWLGLPALVAYWLTRDPDKPGDGWIG